jgi:hypothetical protein
VTTVGNEILSLMARQHTTQTKVNLLYLNADILVQQHQTAFAYTLWQHTHGSLTGAQSDGFGAAKLGSFVVAYIQPYL